MRNTGKLEGQVNLEIHKIMYLFYLILMFKEWVENYCSIQSNENGRVGQRRNLTRR